jgi:hypothetical protein
VRKGKASWAELERQGLVMPAETLEPGGPVPLALRRPK